MDQQQQQNQSVSVNVATSDPMLEQRIFSKVASAGRQLARMADVMTILINQFENTLSEQITEDQQHAINNFRDLCANIKKEKAQHSADYILKQLDTLQANDATEYAKLVATLRSRLG